MGRNNQDQDGRKCTKKGSMTGPQNLQTKNGNKAKDRTEGLQKQTQVNQDQNFFNKNKNLTKLKLN